ncbi:hypothetical protein WG66_014446 [Moniliophthora roreri]|nr:hypothetical protein WG66_014446 [Moniliophthora roreri]
MSRAGAELRAINSPHPNFLALAQVLSTLVLPSFACVALVAFILDFLFDVEATPGDAPRFPFDVGVPFVRVFDGVETDEEGVVVRGPGILEGAFWFLEDGRE